MILRRIRDARGSILAVALLPPLSLAIQNLIQLGQSFTTYTVLLAAFCPNLNFRNVFLKILTYVFFFDDDAFYLVLKKQQLAFCCKPTGYLPLEIEESTCDDAVIMSLMVR
jgi:hypothetical protein